MVSPMAERVQVVRGMVTIIEGVSVALKSKSAAVVLLWLGSKEHDLLVHQ